MFSENLIQLRKLNHMSQEELAEKLDVSRQTLSKWETGESLPDIDRSKLLAEIFGVTLDDLVNYTSSIYGLGVPPRGKYAFGLVTVGEKGQIVIPAKARKVFDINPGDKLLILGDDERGIAVLKEEDIFKQFKTQ
ncbi:MAG: helix-turn-helix domain-containing protein [Lachnospiraceae bacterium]|nr:helix-turn-helix domain-containing protein [Lachnospiraceae bacterium]